MAILIALGALAVSIYVLYELDKLKKADPKIIQKEIEDIDRIKKILGDLKNHDCEVIVKDAMFFIDAIYSIEGKIIDLDDEWVLIKVSGKKTFMKMIRISLIKDVNEILK